MRLKHRLEYFGPVLGVDENTELEVVATEEFAYTVKLHNGKICRISKVYFET